MTLMLGKLTNNYYYRHMSGVMTHCPDHDEERSTKKEIEVHRGNFLPGGGE